VEVWELARGDQERWNRECELFAWGILRICMCIPSFSKPGTDDWRKKTDTLKKFLDTFPPPGYAAERPKIEARAMSPKELGKRLGGKRGR